MATKFFVFIQLSYVFLSIRCRRFGRPRWGEAPIGFHHHKVFHNGAQLRHAFDDFVAVRMSAVGSDGVAGRDRVRANSVMLSTTSMR